MNWELRFLRSLSKRLLRFMTRKLAVSRSIRLPACVFLVLKRISGKLANRKKLVPSRDDTYKFRCNLCFGCYILSYTHSELYCFNWINNTTSCSKNSCKINYIIDISNYKKFLLELIHREWILISSYQFGKDRVNWIHQTSSIL